MDGVASINGKQHTLVARLKENVSQLMGIHCIANRKTLTTQGTNTYFPDLNFIDQTSH